MNRLNLGFYSHKTTNQQTYTEHSHMVNGSWTGLAWCARTNLIDYCASSKHVWPSSVYQMCSEDERKSNGFEWNNIRVIYWWHNFNFWVNQHFTHTDYCCVYAHEIFKNGSFERNLLRCVCVCVCVELKSERKLAFDCWRAE